MELTVACADVDAVRRDLEASGVPIVAPVTGEGFGRQMQLRWPDGLLVKINELDPELYT